MTSTGQLFPDHLRIQHADSLETAIRPTTDVVFTRDHDVIKRWATERQAEPATGEATSSGPATVNVKDGGAGIRLNFPGVSAFRPISWDEWLANFDVHQCAFVYANDTSRPLSNRYRIVKAEEWNHLLP
jgi:hypothetical protein